MLIIIRLQYLNLVRLSKVKFLVYCETCEFTYSYIQWRKQVRTMIFWSGFGSGSLRSRVRFRFLCIFTFGFGFCLVLGKTRVLVWIILGGFAFIPISIVDRARSGLKSAVRQSTDNFQPNYHVSLATGLVWYIKCSSHTLVVLRPRLSWPESCPHPSFSVLDTPMQNWITVSTGAPNYTACWQRHVYVKMWTTCTESLHESGVTSSQTC